MASTQPVLIVSSDRSHRDTLADLVLKDGLRPVCCQSLAAAKILIGRQPFSAVLCEDELSDGQFDSLLREERHHIAAPPIVVISRREDWNSYLAVMALGAFDYVNYPPHTGEIERSLWIAISESRRSTELNMKPAA